MQQEQKCVAKERINTKSDSLTKIQSLLKDNSRGYQDCINIRTPLVTYTAGGTMSKSFNYNDLKL